MIAIERFYRCQNLREDLEVLQERIARMQDGLYRLSEQREADALQRTERYLAAAIKAMTTAQTAARAGCETVLLEAQLKGSIELVNRSPERMRREGE